MLEDVVRFLACPVCRADLTLLGQTLRCGLGHGFDVARQGYVSLLTGSATAGTADTAAMVAARARFLDEGHYAPLAGRVAGLAAERAREPIRGRIQERGQERGQGRGLVADAGAGTGYLLARVLDELGSGTVGLALDLSKHAARRAARAHERIGAVVADVWRPLPMRDDSAALLINAFAPRNGPEFARVLAPGGALVVVTPGPGHLGELVGRLGLLSVDDDKERRLHAALSGYFTQIAETALETEMSLDHQAVQAVVGMGPSAWHTDAAALREKIELLPERSAVPGSFRLTVWKASR